MSSGERPIGAAKGKQSDTEAFCQPPPPYQRSKVQHFVIAEHLRSVELSESGMRSGSCGLFQSLTSWPHIIPPPVLSLLGGVGGPSPW